MAPIIRVALIGLSAKPSWASRAHLPYLLSDEGRKKFTIVALLNSSVEAARASIAAHSLPADSTKAYGDPAALAADPDVDLVVCNTRVDSHYKTIRPSVAAGKAVYSEWPLAHNTEAARELVELARQTSAKFAIGLQARLHPVAHTLRRLLDEGAIGKVLSSEVRAFGGTNDRDRIPTGLTYFLDRAVGGNLVTIGFAHIFDTVQSVLGELSPATARGDFHLQRPNVTVFDPATGATVGTHPSQVPDLFYVSGKFAPGPLIAAQGAPLHFRLRRGQPFPGDPGLVWTIAGEAGEIRLSAPGAGALQIGTDEDPPVIELNRFAAGSAVEKVAWEWPKALSALDTVASRGVGAVYDEIAFAEGVAGGEGRDHLYPHATFDDALRRHEQLDALLGDWKA
ncbi:hypothetical protein B0T26DRAFT_739231 [Lasiosphaeria miniovina]|uniref:Galactose/lactose metabolism regulatory protein GAL80 n=1 Tax=Lasiosphaeria miniovina TaxID=1954250 RepID=A0AA40ATS0_9PEZI|nr:uncharacterized protein B0T26DRAFT_739231 [Lasiosphaeria miniovina]KAK0721826.1 hypothetical protein B0T26DRAFT_739231 [Lasiosphaeria miniovina]